MYLHPGEELNIRSFVYKYPGSQDISDLVQFSLVELIEQEEISKGEEQKIYDQICALEHKWAEQATQTVRIQQAKQFICTPSVSHTANKWKQNEYKWQEISNMVYKMTYRISEETDYRSSKRPRPLYWELSWSIVFNTPKDPDNGNYHKKIAGQSQKRFSDKESLEKYLQGRINAYANLFTEISPPIPPEHQKCFNINGMLLPGYTVENPNALRPDEAAVDELLALLSDDELNGDHVEPDSQPEEKSPQEIWAKNRKQRTGTSQKKTAPTR